MTADNQKEFRAPGGFSFDHFVPCLLKSCVSFSQILRLCALLSIAVSSWEPSFPDQLLPSSVAAVENGLTESSVSMRITIPMTLVFIGHFGCTVLIISSILRDIIDDSLDFHMDRQFLNCCNIVFLAQPCFLLL